MHHVMPEWGARVHHDFSACSVAHDGNAPGVLLTQFAGIIVEFSRGLERDGKQGRVVLLDVKVQKMNYRQGPERLGIALGFGLRVEKGLGAGENGGGELVAIAIVVPDVWNDTCANLHVVDRDGF